MLEAVPQRYQYEFREGRLFLTCEEGNGVYRINTWPQPRCEVRLMTGADWMPCPPPIRVLQHLRPIRQTRSAGRQLELPLEVDIRPSHQEMKYQALREFRDHIPAPVAGFAGKLHTLQWEVLVACSLSERFVDLLVGNPALAYLWISHCKERGFCQDWAAQMLAARAVHGGETSQRQLLRHLGLRSSKGAVRMLRKCHLPALQSDNVELLRTILRDHRRMDRLRHVPRIGTGILKLARSTRILRSCSPAMFTEIATAREELHRAPTAACISEHLALLDELGLPLPRPFRSREDLRHQHRELADSFHERRRELEAILRPPPPAPPRHQPTPAPTPTTPAQSRSPRTRQDGSLPDPPFPGNQHIVPITTRDQLCMEGRVQANCVAGYFRRVRNGSLYIYQVLWPERCTLSIVKRRTGHWVISELEAAHNTRVQDKTRRWVNDWIRTSRNELGQSA